MPAGWAAGAAALGGVAESVINNNAAESIAGKNNANSQNLATAQNTALATGESINSQPFVPYTAPLVAGESGNQAQGTALASSAAANGGGIAGEDFSKATSALDTVAGNSFNPTTIASYENPYISGVVNNEIANANQSYEETLGKNATTSAASGAYGGSALAEENAIAGSQNELNIGNLTANGYSNAYNAAVNAWQADNSRLQSAATGYENAGNDVTKMTSQQISDLMQTGGVAQAISQSTLNADYQQFLRQQGWSANQLQPLLSAIQSSKGGVSQTTPPANNVANSLLGLGSTLAGLYGGSSSVGGGMPSATVLGNEAAGAAQELSSSLGPYDTESGSNFDFTSAPEFSENLDFSTQ